MRLQYTITVVVDPAAIESGNPADVVRNEIKSNLESVDYVKSCVVSPAPLRGGSHAHRAPSGRDR